MTRTSRFAAAACFLVALTACSSDDGDAEPGVTPSATSPSAATSTPATSTPATSAPPTSASPSAPATSSSASTSPVIRPNATPTVVGTVATDLEAPWGIAFLPGGDALVTERDRGTVVRVPAGGGATTRVGTVPGVDAGGEGGLLGIAVSPRFASDSLVYVYLTAGEDNRVLRMTYRGGRLSAPQTVFTGIAKAGIHNGGRIAFGPDGMLYVATGDAGERGASQDRGSPNGKILRLTPEGRPAPGNPVDGSPVWSFGHRNVQGIAWDSRDRLWASEFGQNTWDELNHIVRGANYGWPEVEGPEERAGFVLPEAVWSTDENSPSGVAVAGDAAYVAGLRGERLWQVPVNGERAGRPRAFLTEYGRLRAVALAPDGTLWVGTSNRDGRGDPADTDDRILRVALR